MCHVFHRICLFVFHNHFEIPNMLILLIFIKYINQLKDGVGRKNQCYPARIRRFFSWKNARTVCVSIYTVCTSKMKINVWFDMKMPNGNSFSFGVSFLLLCISRSNKTKRNDTKRNERKQSKDAFNRNRKQIEYTRPLHVHVIVYYA